MVHGLMSKLIGLLEFPGSVQRGGLLRMMIYLQNSLMIYLQNSLLNRVL
jgi:hypothetical protein